MRLGVGQPKQPADSRGFVVEAPCQVRRLRFQDQRFTSEAASLTGVPLTWGRSIAARVQARLNKFDASLLAGFREGATFASLRAARHRGPSSVRGVYAVVYPFDYAPEFLKIGTGGWFRGRDPNVRRDELRGRWVKKSRLLYFGKAGAPGENGNLYDRISLLSRFGRGSSVSHRGGRVIWQIKGSADLVVRWLPTPDEVPRRVEHQLIQRLRHCGKRPFANLQRQCVAGRTNAECVEPAGRPSVGSAATRTPKQMRPRATTGFRDLRHTRPAEIPAPMALVVLLPSPVALSTCAPRLRPRAPQS